MRVKYDHITIKKHGDGDYAYLVCGANGLDQFIGWWPDLQSAVNWVVKEHHPRTIRLDVK